MADLIPHYQSHQLYKEFREVLVEYSGGCSNTMETHNPSDCDECLDAALKALLIKVKDWLEEIANDRRNT